MRVLVTGHQGYIGSVLVPLLLEAKHEVIGLDSGLFRDCVIGQEYGQITTIFKDIRDVTSDDLAEVYAIIHLAGMSFHGGDLDARLTYDVNYNGTLQLASLAKFTGVRRFITLSTYDGAPVPDYIRSGDDLFRKAPELAEHFIGRFLEEDISRLASAEFAPSFLRCNSIYGFSPHIRLDLPVNQIIASAVTTGEAYVPIFNEAFHPGTHVQDVAGAILGVLQAPQQLVYRKWYSLSNVGGPIEPDAFAEILKEAVPGCSVIFVESDATRKTSPSPYDRLSEDLPYFRPNWSIREGIEQLIEAFAAYRLQASDIQAGRFNRRMYMLRLIREGKVDTSLRWFDASNRRGPFSQAPGQRSTPATNRLSF
ncbi:MAG: NAD(P)-dependent oxidoreductase [Anaerolineae bacterium]|nr:NAD(P)-dependent oxidoreductase [Anaerolineae bacterium]